MIDRLKTYDVFLAHSGNDEGLVHLIIETLERSGLTICPFASVPDDLSIPDSVREALVDSSAVIFVVTTNARNSQFFAFEVGMSKIWAKPAYVLYDGIVPSEMPVFLQDFPLHPVANTSHVAKLISELTENLPPEQTSLLVDSYRAFGVSTDGLLRDPRQLDRLTSRFNHDAGCHFTSEQLAHELVRLRKRGSLPEFDRMTTKKSDS